MQVASYLQTPNCTCLKQTAGSRAMEGCRVLRGPDWQGEGPVDGGEVHLGTITELLSDGRVLWNTGQETTCLAGADGKFDLRIFDTGQSGDRSEMGPRAVDTSCLTAYIYRQPTLLQQVSSFAPLPACWPLIVPVVHSVKRTQVVKMAWPEDDSENTPEQCIRLACLLIDSGAFVFAVVYNGRNPTDSDYGQFAVQRAILQYIGDKGDAVLRCDTVDVMSAVIWKLEELENTVFKATSSGKPPSAIQGTQGDYGAADLTLPTPESSSGSKQHDAALLQGLLKGFRLKGASCDVMSDVTLQPCGHKSVCRKCSDTVTHCPV